MPELQENALRERITRFLPKALERALSSYKMIALAHPADKQTRDMNFTDAKKHHDACKMALTHVELLVKLGQRVTHEGKSNNTNAESVEQAELKAMLDKAQEEIEGSDMSI